LLIGTGKPRKTCVEMAIVKHKNVKPIVTLASFTIGKGEGVEGKR